MDKDNMNTELENTDKKLHIYDVMNSILETLYVELNISKQHEEDNIDVENNGYYNGNVRGIEKCIDSVKKKFNVMVKYYS